MANAEGFLEMVFGPIFIVKALIDDAEVVVNIGCGIEADDGAGEIGESCGVVSAEVFDPADGV